MYGVGLWWLAFPSKVDVTKVRWYVCGAARRRGEVMSLEITTICLHLPLVVRFGTLVATWVVGPVGQI